LFFASQVDVLRLNWASFSFKKEFWSFLVPSSRCFLQQPSSSPTVTAEATCKMEAKNREEGRKAELETECEK
jgi:hypothetical protein